MKLNPNLKQFLRFIAVGYLNTLFSYSMYALFIFLELHYSLAALLSTILGVLFNFQTTSYFVFKNNKQNLLFKFILIYVFIYLIYLTGLSLLKNITNSYLAGIIMLPIIVISGFILQKYFVFTSNKDHQQSEAPKHLT